MFLQFRIRINYSFFFCAGKTSRTFINVSCMNSLKLINSCILTLDENSFTKLLLYGDGRYGSKTNTSIILASVNFIYSSERVDG